MTYAGRSSNYLVDKISGSEAVLQENINGQTNLNYYLYSIGSATPLFSSDGVAGSNQWYHQDATGSVRVLSNDANGLTVANYAYTAYGNTQNVGGISIPNKATTTYRFDGQRFDPDGLLYSGSSNYYLPSLGESVSVVPGAVSNTTVVPASAGIGVAPPPTPTAPPGGGLGSFVEGAVTICVRTIVCVAGAILGVVIACVGRHFFEDLFHKDPCWFIPEQNSTQGCAGTQTQTQQTGPSTPPSPQAQPQPAGTPSSTPQVTKKKETCDDPPYSTYKKCSDSEVVAEIARYSYHGLDFDTIKNQAIDEIKAEMTSRPGWQPYVNKIIVGTETANLYNPKDQNQTSSRCWKDSPGFAFEGLSAGHINVKLPAKISTENVASILTCRCCQDSSDSSNSPPQIMKHCTVVGKRWGPPYNRDAPAPPGNRFN